MASAKLEVVVGVLQRSFTFAFGKVRDSFGRLSSWVRRDPRASGSTAVIAFAAIAVVVAMVMADGFRARTYDLEESAVWVVNQEARKFGRINTQIGEQDAMGATEGDNGGADVAQDGRDIFVQSGEAWRRVDPKSVTMAESATDLFPGASVAVGGGRIAVMDSAGAVWIGVAAQAEQLKIGDTSAATNPAGKEKKAEQTPKARPAVKASGDARVAVGVNGDVAVLSGQGALTVVPRHGKRPPSKTLAGFKGDVGSAQVSMVGSDPVVLSGSRLFLPSGKTADIPGSEPLLQLPGDDSRRVIVASSDGVYSVATSDGRRKVLHAGTALSGVAAPVNVGGVVYAAWAGPEASVLYQSGAQKAVMKVSDSGLDLPAGADLVWRVNRSRVALNEVKHGAVLTVIDGKLVRSDNWDENTTPSPSTSTPNSENRKQDLVFDPKTNQAPVANPDEAGGRPNIPTIVDVLANDEDQNNDPLTIVDIEGVVGGKVELIQGGQVVQVTPAGMSPVTFTYRAFDGLLKSKDSAPVTVTPHGPDSNEPPVLRKERVPKLTVGANKTASYNLVSDYEDPEGDPIVLRRATADESAGAKVAFQSGGLITYTDTLGEAGSRIVHFEIGDAPQVPNIPPASAQGQLPVTVTAAGVNSPPVARYDYAQVLEGQSVVVWPLHNDNDPDDDELTFELLPKDKLPSGVVKNGDGSVTVTATTLTLGRDGSPTPILFGYEVTDGPNSVQARIRVDVIPKNAPPQPPSAALDLIVLPLPTGNGPVERTTDLLLNDFSPTGRVLVVTQVDTSGVHLADFRAQLLEHRRLRISYPAQLSQPVTLSYTVSDGQNSAAGRVVVVSSTQSEQLVPTAIPDSITVRAGDAVNIAVLANDVDPAGGKLYLHRDLEGPVAGGGLAFTSGDVVRFLAPDKAMSVRFSYYLTDRSGLSKRSAGEVVVKVQKADENRAPVPPMIEARVLSGSTVKITVPLSGVDPDGDSVRLLGLGYAGGMEAAPQHGQITEVGVDYLIYQAFEGESGTDEFRYRVVDTGGPTGKPVEAEGVIRVGVALRPDTGNQSPVALPDAVKVRPGGQLLFNPMVNDFDPDGDMIGFASKDPLSGAPEGLDVSVNGGRLAIKAPSSAGTYSVRYRVQDTLQSVSEWTKVEVTVDADAAGLPPTARDDIAEGEPDQQTVSVKVLDNDDDPDGDPAKLKVRAVSGYPGTPAADGRKFEVPVTASSQVIPYEVLDEQGLTTIAFVRVRPATADKDKPPRLKSDDVIEVTASKAPKPVTVKLDKYVEDPDGKAVRFVDANNSIAGRRGVTGLIVDAETFTVTAPTIVDEKDVAGLIGDAAISIVVTDTPVGAEEHPVMLQIPVKVKADRNLPPKWKPIGQVQVTRNNKEPSDPLDLGKLADDPDGDALIFAIEKIPGVVIERSGSDNNVLTFVGSTSLESDSTLPVKLTVATKRNPAVETTLTLKVIDTLKPPATIESFDLDAELGKAVKIDTLDGATNPFDDVPLELDSPSVKVSTGQGEAVVSGNSISFTPGKVGPATVSYLVVDKVKRKVASTATFTVRDKPARITQPSVVQLSSRSVEVRFDAPIDNGSPIDKYKVRADTGATTDCGQQLVCTVSGLTPAQTYTFTVTATNKIGESEPSSESPPITPDECAGAPKNVLLEFDKATNPADLGGQLKASWDAPDNDGSPIQDYEVKVIGTDGYTRTTKALSETLDNLQNGDVYTISVRARNQCKAQFGEAAESASAIPAALPDVPEEVRASRIDNKARTDLGGRAEVSWTAYNTTRGAGKPNINGDAIIEYVITPQQGNEKPQTIPAANVGLNGGRHVAEINVDQNGGPYTFTVSATNKAGTTRPSAASPEVTVQGKPGVPTGLKSWASVKDTVVGLDGKLSIEFNDPVEKGGSGVSIVRREYSLDGGKWTAFTGGTGESPFKATIDGLSNTKSEPYSLRVRVLNQGKGEGGDKELPSDPSAPISGSTTNSGSDTKPYGPLPQPRVSATRSGTSVNFEWNANGGTKGTEIKTASWWTTGGKSGTGSSGSVSDGGAYSTTYGITVTFTDDREQTATNYAEARTVDPPTPSIGIDWGGAGSDSGIQGCGSGKGCQWIVGEIFNFPAGATVNVECRMNGVTYRTVKGIVVRSDGGGGWGTGWCLGKPNTGDDYTATWSSATSNAL